ncbi:tyrosine-protein phosphatase [Jeotgalibacillus malaysiensis]|uniref:tyrosine-protein phosphatase n=1 Tax=Jeotgalibacillus malaysiensis TaxID=1508404 RepID=UPI00385161C1
MIDIHCHILPGVDDGAQDYHDSLKMANQAVQNGITHIIATPHHQTRRFQNEAQNVIEAVADLNEYFQDHQVDLKVHPGQEIRLYGEIVAELKSGLDLPIASADNPYVLVEFPSSQVPAFAERVLYEMLVEGYRPIIAHPERNSAIVEDPEKLYQLINQGAIAQLTAASLAGEFNKSVQRFSMELIESNLVHVIASDAHNTDFRGFANQKAYELLDQKFGLAEQFQMNAQNIMEGKQIISAPPSAIQKKGFFAKLLNR